MDKDIRHKGLIFDIVGNRIDVSVTPEAACEGCRAKAMCGVGGSNDKMVSVFVRDSSFFSVGQEVMLSIKRSMGVRAVVLAYVVPFIVVLVILTGMHGAGFGEVASGLSSLGFLALYYVVLYFLRDRIDRHITFNIDTGI